MSHHEACLARQPRFVVPRVGNAPGYPLHGMLQPQYLSHIPYRQTPGWHRVPLLGGPHYRPSDCGLKSQEPVLIAVRLLSEPVSALRQIVSWILGCYRRHTILEDVPVSSQLTVSNNVRHDYNPQIRAIGIDRRTSPFQPLRILPGITTSRARRRLRDRSGYIGVLVASLPGSITLR